jgi:ABC-2 type transport system ATP-binding protein
VWGLITRLRDDGVAVVLTTHQLDEAERLADVVVMMAGGRVAAIGSPSQLTSGANDMIQFSGPAGLDLSALRGALSPLLDAKETSPGRYCVQTRADGPLDPQTLVTVSSWCVMVGVAPQGLGVSRRTLEDVFFEMVAAS